MNTIFNKISSSPYNGYITLLGAIFAQMDFFTIIRNFSAVTALIVGILTIIKLVRDLIKGK